MVHHFLRTNHYKMFISERSVTCSFFRNCTHILTRIQMTKFKDIFLVKIASKGTSLTLFDISFFEPSVIGGGGGGGGAAYHNFVVIAPMIMKFGTGMKLDVFYTMATKHLLLLRNYDVITCILADV